MHEGTQREKIFKQILDSAFFVHSELGPGLLESAMSGTPEELYSVYFTDANAGYACGHHESLPWRVIQSSPTWRERRTSWRSIWRKRSISEVSTATVGGGEEEYH